MPPIMFFSNFPISYARWASTPMFYSQCNCNNNSNNSWMNWWMMSEMVKNIGQMFRKPEKQPPIPYAYNPYQQYTQPMYPYLNLNNSKYPYAPTQEVDEDLMNLQKVYKDCKTKFNFAKINDKYIAITKDGHRIKAETADELMDKIDEYIDNDKGGLKPTKVEDDTDSDSDIDVDSDTDVDSDIDTDNDNKPGRITIPDKWQGCGTDATKLSEGLQKLFSEQIKAGMTAKEVMQALIKYESETHNLDLSGVDVDKLSEELEKVNPSIFVDGKVKEGYDVNKFTFPAKAYFDTVAKAKPERVKEYPQTQAVQDAAKKLHEGLGFFTTDVDDIEEIIFDGNKFNSDNCVAVAMAYQNQSSSGNSLLGDIQRDTYLYASAVKVYLQQIAGKFVLRARKTVTNPEHKKIVENYYNYVKNKDKISTSENWKERVKVWEIMKAYETGKTDDLEQKLRDIDNAQSEQEYMRK